ncbi:MAG: hypothetical protein JWL72_4339, partial [Ilumatobacteraceae bacterium]|nr:hypothetical protein [Ilumatobacteraceae bacterium]
MNSAERADSETFDRAVQLVRGGADARSEAVQLYELLT